MFSDLDAGILNMRWLAGNTLQCAEIGAADASGNQCTPKRFELGEQSLHIVLANFLEVCGISTSKHFIHAFSKLIMPLISVCLRENTYNMDIKKGVQRHTLSLCLQQQKQMQAK